MQAVHNGYNAPWWSNRYDPIKMTEKLFLLLVLWYGYLERVLNQEVL